MKVVYASMSAIPSRMANSIQVMKMCQAFARNGHDVVLITPKQPVDQDLKGQDQDIYQLYGVENCFRIVKLPWFPLKGRALMFGFCAALKAKGEKADLLYGRDINSCYFASILNLPVIYESHQPINTAGSFYNNLFKKMIARKTFKRLVVISAKLKDYYRKNYSLKEKQVLVAHDAADKPPQRTESVNITSASGAETALQVGYLGHLYPGKGMEIISDLVPRCPWAHFHVVGGSSQDIVYWQKKVGHAVNLTFHGFKPHNLMDGYLAAFHVLLAPYQESVISGGSDIARWMSPLKLFEYMAAGKPIVCSDLPVLREVLEDGKDALLCPPEDLNSWVKALKLFSEDKVLRDKLGRAAYAKFIKYHTWAKRADLVLAGF